MAVDPVRYAFRHTPPAAALDGRKTSAAILFVAVAIIFLTQDTPAIVLSLILAVVAGVFILKPFEWNAYVEVTDEKLIIKWPFGRAKLNHNDIASGLPPENWSRNYDSPPVG